MRQEEPLTREEILHGLHENALEIAAISGNLTDDQASRKPSVDEWSVNEILAHLRACADKWGDAIRTMLAEDHPRIRAVNPRKWIKSTDYPVRPFSTSLAEYRTQRADLLTLLTELDPNDWERGAAVYGAGNELERTIAFYAQWLVRHERSHMKELRRVAELAGNPRNGLTAIE